MRFVRHEIPVVEHDVPMPRKVLDGRSLSKKVMKAEESPWVPFLKGLKVGDSFVVRHSTVNYVKIKAKELKIDLMWHYNEPEPHRARIWIYGIEGDRSPVYAVIKKTEEVVMPGES